MVEETIIDAPIKADHNHKEEHSFDTLAACGGK